ncbi:MAG: DMT family transporter [Laribacter sp.]|nr:DMT family transporter [Laribacter sp.]MBP9526866.1 DMT family transporter [Laribacter sp.]MBP9609599.1 DMT family transporter [Laribacter sp.]
MPASAPAVTPSVSVWQRVKTGQLGSAWMLVASALFGCMGVCVKFGSNDFDAPALVFWRSVFGAVVLGSLALLRGKPILTPLWTLQVKRSLFGFFSLVGYFYALTQLSLATAVTLNYTSAIFLALLSLVWLRERLTPRILLALLLGLAGVSLLLRPAVGDGQWLAGLVGLSSGLTAACAYLQVRELSRMGEPEWRVVLWFSAVGSVCGLVWVWLGDSRVLPTTTASLWPLLGMGLTGMLAQLALTRAYAEGRKFVVASLAYSTVIFSALFGAWLFGDRLGPDSLLAIAVIVGSGIIASRR